MRLIKHKFVLSICLMFVQEWELPQYVDKHKPFLLHSAYIQMQAVFNIPSGLRPKYIWKSYDFVFDLLL